MGASRTTLPKLSLTIEPLSTYFMKGEAASGGNISQQVFGLTAELGPLTIGAISSGFPAARWAPDTLWRVEPPTASAEEWEPVASPAWPGPRLQEWLESFLPYDPLTATLVVAESLPAYSAVLWRLGEGLNACGNLFATAGQWTMELETLWAETKALALPYQPAVL